MDFRGLPDPPPDYVSCRRHLLRDDRSCHLSIAQQLYGHGLRKNVDQLVHGVCATLFGFVIALSVQRSLTQLVRVLQLNSNGELIQASRFNGIRASLS